MPTKPTEKSTKAEILNAYNQLAEEKKAIEVQLRTNQKQAAAIPTPPIAKIEPKATMNTAPDRDKIDYTIASLAKLQLGFGAAVSELSEKLTTEAAQLAEIREQVAVEISDLQTLHNLEVGDDTFEELLTSYETSTKAFGEELTRRQEAHELAVQTQNKAWQKEIEQHEFTVKENGELARKNSHREAQEYKYNLDLERKLDREQHEQQQLSLERELAEAKEAYEKATALRELGIEEREKTFHEAKDKVAAFAQERETAVKKAKEEGKGIATYQAKIKSDLYAKDVESQKRFYEGRIESLENNIANQGERLDSLSKQLEAALKQVQDLAVKAIEGSANATSYQTLKEITLEQAKSQAKTK
jgi:uncharacterized coiled-coil protein SlyX